MRCRHRERSPSLSRRAWLGEGLTSGVLPPCPALLEYWSCHELDHVLDHAITFAHAYCLGAHHQINCAQLCCLNGARSKVLASRPACSAARITNHRARRHHCEEQPPIPTGGELLGCTYPACAPWCATLASTDMFSVFMTPFLSVERLVRPSSSAPSEVSLWPLDRWNRLCGVGAPLARRWPVVRPTLGSPFGLATLSPLGRRAGATLGVCSSAAAAFRKQRGMHASALRCTASHWGTARPW